MRPVTRSLGQTQAAETIRLGDDPAPGSRPLHAVVVLDGLDPDRPLPDLEWVPVDGGKPQPVEVVEP